MMDYTIGFRVRGSISYRKSIKANSLEEANEKAKEFLLNHCTCFAWSNPKQDELNDISKV